jgi:hypothetical protein
MDARPSDSTARRVWFHGKQPKKTGGGVAQHGGPLEVVALGVGADDMEGRCVITGGDPKMRKKKKKKYVQIQWRCEEKKQQLKRTCQWLTQTRGKATVTRRARVRVKP